MLIIIVSKICEEGSVTKELRHALLEILKVVFINPQYTAIFAEYQIKTAVSGD